MIIGYNFFGFDEGAIFDTPITTDMLDEIIMNEGVYDEAYIDLDMDVTDVLTKPLTWKLKTILDAKFRGDLDAGSLGADGFKVTHINLYRSLVGEEKWNQIAQFVYDDDYNVYDFLDRYVQNGAIYRYAIVPSANGVMGDMLFSDPITVSYEGIFLTDGIENMRLEYDIALNEISYNGSSSVNTPLNGQYPIVTFGNTNYRSGSLSVLPLSDSTIAMHGAGIDKLQEQINRNKWMSFLNNHRAKVLRMDSGVLMLVVTQNAKVTHKEGDILRDLASVSFDFTEMGDLTFSMMMSTGLISEVDLSKAVFAEDGTVAIR